jgi:N-acetylneuraminic acid mutarotase
MKVFTTILILSSILLSPPTLCEHAEGRESEIFGELVVLPEMTYPRYNHTVDILSGNLIVTGGTRDGSDSLDSCEKLDVNKRIWKDIAPMSLRRMRHAAIPYNGKLMVTGGYIGEGHPSLFRHYNGQGNISLSSCELYDPEIDEWETMPPLITGRFWHAMVDHPDLGILVIGGLNTTSGALSTCEVFDEAKAKWIEFPSLPEPLVRFSIGILGNGDIMISGGHAGLEKRSINRSYIYGIGTGHWKEAPPMLHPRGYAGFSVTGNGRFAVSGGFTEPGSSDRRDAEVYDPQENRWELLGELMFPRHGHGSVWIEDSGLFIAGGSNCETGGCHSNIEIYDEDNGEWFDSGHLVVARKWCGVTSDNSGNMFITGGKACDYPTGNTEMIRFESESSVRQNSGTEVDPIAVLLMVIIVIIVLVSADLYLKKEA